MNYFDGVKVGDTVYSGEHGWRVIEVATDSFLAVNHYNTERRVTLFGTLYGVSCLAQLFFWQPVTIIAPPKPKVMVKKEVVRYATDEALEAFLKDRGQFIPCLNGFKDDFYTHKVTLTFEVAE